MPSKNKKTKSESKSLKLWGSLMKNPNWRKLAKKSVDDSKQIEKNRKKLNSFLMKELKNI
jgi:hypothetical protein